MTSTIDRSPLGPGWPGHGLADGAGVSAAGFESFRATPPWRVVLGAVVLCAVTSLLGAQGAVVAELLKDEEWQAVSEMEFRDPLLLPETVAVTLESPSIWHPVAEAEAITDEEFQKNYESAVAGGTQIIQIRYVDTDPDRARRITDAIVANYVERFSASPIEDQTRVLEDYVASLRALEASIEASLEDRALLSTAVQIDLQDRLVRTREQINEITLRTVAQQDAEQERSRIDPRLVTAGFILDEPVTPAPMRAAVFGGFAGGLIGVLLSYLAFHRTALPVDGRRGGVSPSTGVSRTGTPGYFTPAAADAGSTTPTRRAVGLGSWLGMTAKRSVDVVASSLLLVVASPLLLLVAALVKVSSPGPVLFRQERVGRHGSSFRIAKFRTMYIDNDDSAHRANVEQQLRNDASPGENGSYKLVDPRVTRIGRLLRRLSLDELPQLWNVLRGEMSLVGPRPALAWEHQLFEPRHRDRILAAPGCTGLWQVSGRSTLSTREMLELDLDYVRNWSLWRDLVILARTPLALLRGDGAR